MKMKVPKTLLKLAQSCLLLVLPLISNGQTTQKITLNDAIAKGLQQSRELKMDHTKVDMAVAKYNSAKDALYPDVKLAASYTYLSDLDQKTLSFGPVSFLLYTNNNYMGHASVTEPVFVGFREKYAEESARLLVEASKLDVEKDKDDVVINIINSYFNLYKAQTTRTQIQDNITQIKQRLSEVQDALKSGAAIQNDVLRVQLQLSNTQLAEIQATDNINIVNFNMGVLLGLPANTQIEIDSASMFAAKNLKTSDEYQRDALNQRQELRAGVVRTQAAETGIKIAKGAYFPTVGVGADYFYARPNQRYFPVLDEFKPTWDAGINLTWDLTTLFTNKHQIAEAQAGLDQSLVANAMQGDNIRMEVNSSYTTYVESLKRIEVAKTAVEQATENYRTLTSRYNNHVSLLSDLLDANTLLLQSKINETLATADAELAYKKLLKASGNLK